MIRRALIASSLAVSALIGVVPGVAWAPRVTTAPDQVGACSVATVDVTGEGRFLGDFSVTSFDAKGDDLVANVLLTGACTVSGTPVGITNAVGSAVADVSAATCDHLSFGFSGSVAEKDAVVVDLSEMDLTIEQGKATGPLLCRVAKAGDRMGSAELASILNRYLNK